MIDCADDKSWAFESEVKLQSELPDASGSRSGENLATDCRQIYVGVRIRQVCHVESVKVLGAELQVHPFVKVEVLVQRKILVGNPRSAQDVPARIANGKHRRNGEIGDIEPLVAT